MNVVGIDHVVIHVSDWGRSNAFYRDVLGAEVLPSGEGWVYQIGAFRLNCHGPGVVPNPVARVPVPPGGSDLSSSGTARRPRRWPTSRPAASGSSWGRFRGPAHQARA